MSASLSHKLWQSKVGLDNAGMDFRGAQFNAHTSQKLDSAYHYTGLEGQLPFLVGACAVVGAILFAFLVLLWLRKQMSREKSIEESDQRGLVEEGNLCISSIEKNKDIDKLTSLPEVVWTPETIVKPCSSCSIAKVSIENTIPPATSELTDAVVSVRPKPKRLLDRRPSKVNLTIELAPTTDSRPPAVTPTRECMAEEYLLSASSVLTRTQLKRIANDPVALYKEFWEIPQNYPDEVEVSGSGIKNRYAKVLPNTRSRVILPGSDDPVASYINANYIRGYDNKIRYIATQGPLTHTIQDFWSMVWSERSSAIVMMTRIREVAKTQCEIYFPTEENSRVQIGPFTIKLVSMDTRGGYAVRDLEIRRDNVRRIVQHFWYDSWPDHAVPPTADAIVGLAAEINTLPGPIVVHCSAGIGRTGGFIALATGMSQLRREGSVDVLSCVCQMRYDRGGMIQTPEQYEFVHKALCLFEKTLDS